MSEIIKSIDLAFKEGTSDKVYKAAVEKISQGDGYIVTFAFGRRGSTLNTGVKTGNPVSVNEAISIYDKLVFSKTAKGYKVVGKNTGIGSSVVPKNVTTVKDVEQKDFGMRPQLLNPISEDEAAKYLTDDLWCAQEKFNGKRMTIKKDKDIVAFNKKGLNIGFPDAIAASMKQFGKITVDGEAVGDVFHAFDMLDCDGKDWKEIPYISRLIKLQEMAGNTPSAVRITPTAFSTQQKMEMMANLKAAGKEGIVFKKLSSKWYAGRPASGGSAIKCKFWASASCVVLAINAKRSIKVSLEGQEIGNVTIPPNKDIPAIGSVAEIKYLYVVGKGGSLYQPTYLGTRDDVDVSECTFAQQQLKYKPEDED